MLGMNGGSAFASLILPGTLAEVLIGSRVSLMAGWGTVIVAELVAADSGLGAHLIAVEQSYDVAGRDRDDDLLRPHRLPDERGVLACSNGA